jgi:hypothetical protein
VQKVSGTKVSKKTSGPVTVVVRFVNILTDISQQVVDIYQSRYHYLWADFTDLWRQGEAGMQKKCCESMISRFR